MGQHYVPQAYLRGFEDPARPGFIWVQSRAAKKPRLAAIDEVAQSRGFYEEATEVLLASLIEAPANPVLAKLRQGQTIAPSERAAVAVYMATMMKRVPRGRARAESLTKPILDELCDEYRRTIGALLKSRGIDVGLAERRLTEVDAVQAKFSAELPSEVLKQVRDPMPTDPVVQAILKLRWRVLVAQRNEFFITSDNPLFYHEAYGVGTTNAEVRLPLSPKAALFCHHTDTRDDRITVHPAPREWLRDFNRSIAGSAVSIAMAHRAAPFLRTLLNRKDPYLSRLVWSDASLPFN